MRTVAEIMAWEQEQRMTVHVIQSDFEIGERVKKVSGDYILSGTVVGVVEAFPGQENSPVRYIIRHMAEGGGWFLHIYNRSQLKSIDRTVRRNEEAHDA